MSATKTAAVPGPIPALGGSYLRAILWAAWKDNRLLVLVAAAFVLAGFLAQAVTGIPGLMRDVLYLASFQNMLMFLLLPLPLAFLVGRLQVRDKDGRFLPGPAGWRIARQRFVDRFANPRSLARALVAGLVIVLVLNTFGSWKRVIPVVHPFSWDEPLARFDRTLHFGVDPWVLLQPLLGNGRFTLWLDNLYYTWLPLIFSAMGFLIWTRRSDLRLRGLLGIAFVWIGLGTVGATLFSSAGPCFYGYLVNGTEPFQPLMAYLQTTREQFSLFAPRLQETMWALSTSGQADIYLGISAMPSVHVAMPALLGFIGWERNRWLGVLFWSYTGLIVIATVHLGWHYAIDGYASILAVWLYWRLSARLTPGMPSSPDPQA